jgi:hypothetical protein
MTPVYSFVVAHCARANRGAIECDVHHGHQLVDGDCVIPLQSPTQGHRLAPVRVCPNVVWELANRTIAYTTLNNSTFFHALWLEAEHHPPGLIRRSRSAAFRGAVRRNRLLIIDFSSSFDQFHSNLRWNTSAIDS